MVIFFHRHGRRRLRTLRAKFRDSLVTSTHLPVTRVHVTDTITLQAHFFGVPSVRLYRVFIVPGSYSIIIGASRFLSRASSAMMVNDGEPECHRHRFGPSDCCRLFLPWLTRPYVSVQNPAPSTTNDVDVLAYVNHVRSPGFIQPAGIWFRLLQGAIHGVP